MAAKSVYETVNGEVLFSFLHMGLCGTPLAACHLGGAAGGAVLFFGFRLATRHPARRPERRRWVHWAARAAAGLCYRLRIEGAAHFPATGPAVVVANHVSYFDPVLIAAACPRPIRFVVYGPYYRLPVLHLFFRAAGAIPIASAKRDPGALRRAMEEIQQALKSKRLFIAASVPPEAAAPDRLRQIVAAGAEACKRPCRQEQNVATIETMSGAAKRLFQNRSDSPRKEHCTGHRY